MSRTLVLCFGILACPWTSPAWGQVAGGIQIDPEGVLRYLNKPQPVRAKPSAIDDAIRARADVREVSLGAILRELERIEEAGSSIPPEIAHLAGLVKIVYVVIDRPRRDVILAGPAEGWEWDRDGRPVGRQTRRAVLHLEDLASALRCVLDGPGEANCSIDPTAAGLRATQELNYPKDANIRSGEAFRREVTERFGMQTVTTSGVPDGSRFARVMVEADYRMKGMALGREKMRGIASHLDNLVQLTERGQLRNSLTRWWFTPSYDSLITNEARTVFQFTGQGVKLENEEVFVDRTGRRSGSGQSNPAGDPFSESFTKAFPEIEKRYPVYADLHNLFDLMMVAALIKHEGLADAYRGTILMREDRFPLATGVQPTKAEPVVMYRMHQKKKDGVRINYTTIAFGGVSVRPRDFFAKDAFVANADGMLARISESRAVVNTDNKAPDALGDANPNTDPNDAATLAETRWWADIKSQKSSEK